MLQIDPAQRSRPTTGRTVTTIRTAGGGNQQSSARYRHWPFRCCSRPVVDMVRSQTVGLDEFIARWIGRLRRRPYTGPPDRLWPSAGL